MARQKFSFKWKNKKCTFKWQGKSVRLMARQKCTFGKAKVYVYMARQKCTYKLQHKSVRLYGKTKLYV